ncbi:MAG: ABC transporter substrate-binding protein [Acutalibacteraceae bacterium]
MRKITAFVVAALLAVSVLTGCAGSESEHFASKSEGKSITESSAENAAEESGSSTDTAHYPVTVSNFNYAKEAVEYTYEKAPERVITFWSNSLETMLALGLGDRIICAVGMDEDAVLPELQDELKKCTENMEYYNDFKDSNAAMSKEAAVMMEPDFILGWQSSFSDKTIGDVDYWNENGVGTYMALNSNSISEQRTLENEYADILNIGKIFDVEDKAQALVDEMRAEVERITAATEGREKRSVLIVEFMKDTIWVYDDTMLAGDMVKAMGGDVINAGDIGAEDLLNIDPEVMIVIGDETDVQSVMENPAYASLQCVENNDVHSIDLSEVYTSGVRTIHGLNHIGQILYPDLYAENEAE